MSLAVYALHCVIVDAPRKIDGGRDMYLKANFFKLPAIEGGRRVTHNDLLIFRSYLREYPVELLYRDLKLNRLEINIPTIHYLLSARKLLVEQRTDEGFHKKTGHRLIEMQIRIE